MAQNSHQRTASTRVAAWLSQNEHNNAWLAAKAKIDLGTVGDFLNGLRWPKAPTQGKIEKALGWPPGSIHQLGQGDAVDVPMEPAVSGDPQDADRSEDDYVKAPGATVESDITNADLMREILRSRAEYDQLRAEVRDVKSDVRDVSERVARLEQNP